jgi:hypothetical protein
VQTHDRSHLVSRLVVWVLNWISMIAVGRAIEGLAHLLYDGFVKQVVDFRSLLARLLVTQAQYSAEIEFDNPVSMHYGLCQRDTFCAQLWNLPRFAHDKPFLLKPF